MKELALMKIQQTTVHTQMKKDMKELKEKTDKMYNVFITGSGFVTVLKILGIIAVSVTGFLLTVKQLSSK